MSIILFGAVEILSRKAMLPCASLSTVTRKAALSASHSLLPSLSESASIQHERSIFFRLLADIIHDRELIPSAPALPSIEHTRTLFRPLATITHSRTLVPRAVILQAGTSEGGTAQAGSANTITLSQSASSTDGFYVGMFVTQQGETRRITVYVGSTRVATVESNWTTPPVNGTPYTISIARPTDTRVLKPVASVVET